MVAYWLGTTEAQLDLLLDLVGVVVPEAAAYCAWYFAILRPVRPGRATVASDWNATLPQQDGVTPVVEETLPGRVEQCATHVTTMPAGEPVANDASRGPAMSDDDRRIAEIRGAVVAGRLKRNLASLRKFVGYAQSEATRLNRLYIERFGNAHTPRAASLS